jgi:PAS domain-containing protein
LEKAMERPRIEAWHEQEASYSLLFVQNPTPMWLIDDETLAFLEVNDAAVRHYGYMREEFLRMALRTSARRRTSLGCWPTTSARWRRSARGGSGRPACGGTTLTLAFPLPLSEMTR